MKVLFLLAAITLWANGSDAQPSDVVRGPHGGKLQEVAGVEIELLFGDSEVALCVYSTERAPLDVRRYKALVDIVIGGNREQITLHPEGSGVRLVGKSNASLRHCSALTLYVTTPADVKEPGCLVDNDISVLRGTSRQRRARRAFGGN